MKGTIITWNGERYFGFVQSLEFKDGLFFHGSSVLEPPGTELAKGIAVEFQTDHDRTGRPRAINVRVVGQSPPRRLDLRRSTATAIATVNSAIAGMSGSGTKLL